MALSKKFEYIPFKPTTGLPADSGHMLTASGVGSTQTIFLDYFPLKGVRDIRIDHRAGEPMIATITLYLSAAKFSEPEAD